MDYLTAIENTEYALSKVFKSIKSDDSDARVGYSYVSACELCRNFSALKFLHDGDIAMSKKSLQQSASIWLKYLETKQETANSECLLGSRFYPMLDALIIQDVPTAKKIAKLFPEHIETQWEYAEDYYFYKTIAEMVLGVERNQIDQTLISWSKEKGENDDFYYDMLNSIHTQSEVDFVEAMNNVILDREETFEEWRAAPTHDEEVEYVNRFVYFNGLALLELSKLRGLEIRETFYSLPTLLRN